jgi:hypothetical protein
LLGLFSDEHCSEPYTDLSPDNVLGYNISYHLFSHTYDVNGNTCLSCKEYDNNGNYDEKDDDDDNDGDHRNENDKQDADAVNEMCEQVYGSAAKCESIYGIDGFIQDNRQDGDYENQVENEFMVCEFINALLKDSYTETGDINLVGESVTMFQDVTPLQKTTFYLLSVSIIILLIVAFVIQRQIDKSYPKVDLAWQREVQII